MIAERHFTQASREAIAIAEAAVTRCAAELAEATASLQRDRLACAAVDETDPEAVVRARENLAQARRAEALAADRLEHARDVLRRRQREAAA